MSLSMEVERVSTQFIKPTTSTPIHLKTYEICLLDQFAPHGFTPLLLFFQPTTQNNTTDRSQLLKHSLSDTLALFYPFAGKINDDKLSIDCNDVGVPYVEARVNCSLAEYLKKPNISLLEKFLPDDYINLPISESHVFTCQENVFTCGGIALGLRGWHGIIDGTLVPSILKTWSAFARKSNHEVIFPDFIASSNFPQNKSFPPELNCAVLASGVFALGSCSLRRFVFDGTVITKLKNDFKKRSIIQNPTRTEVVIAILGKLVMEAMKTTYKLRYKKQTLLNFPINLRPHATPLLSQASVGNLHMMGTSLIKDEDDLDGIVLKIREAKSKINGDLVKNLGGEGGLVKFIEILEELGQVLSNNECEHIGFNGWCNFGLYDLDFGLGKPMWIPFFNTNIKNFILMMDTQHGHGIEAWVSLGEDVMEIVEQDEKLLSLSSIDPTPLRKTNPLSSSSKL